jgi:hypothetical protein
MHSLPPTNVSIHKKTHINEVIINEGYQSLVWLQNS